MTMKTIIFLLLMTGTCFADSYIVPHYQQNQQERLRHNPYNNQWSYEKDNSRLKHNPYDNTWEYVEPGQRLLHNPYNNTWE